ncbi:MAG TPA: hypothetical protein VF131_26145 [Blastocatellia bacterium]|nr:hypothetical protein [Blastocatellia bacterium]
MGILQFIVLSMFILIYLVITGALVFRLFGLSWPERLSRSN